VTVTEASAPTETEPHAFDELHKVLTSIIDRIPWHSEAQRNEMLDGLRNSEVAIKGDDIERSPAVVPASPVPPAVPDPVAAAIAAAGQPAPIDYDKLAAALVKAQAKAAPAAPVAVDAPAEVEATSSLPTV
jgi:hypothetical protein